MKICCIEFSNILTDEKRSVLDVMNRELFYKFKAKDGYMKSMDFTEFPQWINYVQGVVHPTKVDIHICRSISDTINFIKESEYDYIFFSNIVCSSDYIQAIIEHSYSKSVSFIIGTGVGSVKLDNTKANTYQYDSIGEFAKIHNLGKDIGVRLTGYETEYNPRIYTTYGCQNRCKFCKNDGAFGILDIHTRYMYQSLMTDNVLIYVGNKTFLQGGQNELDTLSNIRKGNRFIVQSCVNTLRDNIHLFQSMYDVGIRVVEIGVESFSTSTLHRLGKSNDLEALPIIVNSLNKVGIKVIFNIMVGIKGDTFEDYVLTINNLYKYEDSLYALNITNYSDYDAKHSIDKDERILIKSWIKESMIQATKDFAEDLYKFNYKLITK